MRPQLHSEADNLQLLFSASLHFQSIKKGFAELTTQKWSTSALEIFYLPSTQYRNEHKDGRHIRQRQQNDRHENKHEQHRHTNRQKRLARLRTVSKMALTIVSTIVLVGLSQTL